MRLSVVDFDFLSALVEHVDEWLSDGFGEASFAIAVVLAALLGLRHASDPDHLVAVTSLMLSEDGGIRDAGRLGAWWGAGHASILIVAGVPIIAFNSQFPGWIEDGAERLVGGLIILLAVRVLARSVIARRFPERQAPAGMRTRGQAFAIGMLHGFAGTGAVVLLLVNGMPGQVEAATALAVFAPMSIVSMAACTMGFAWLLTHRTIEPVLNTVIVPGIGVFGVMFGVWYTGLLG